MAATDYGLGLYQGEWFAFNDSETDLAGVDLGLGLYQGEWIGYAIPAAGGSPQTAYLSGLSTASSLGSQSLSPGVATISPTARTTASALGSQSILPGAVTASPTALADASSLGSQSLSPGAVTISPSGLAPVETLDTQSLSPGAVTISPSSLATAKSLGTPGLIPGAGTVVDGLIYADPPVSWPPASNPWVPPSAALTNYPLRVAIVNDTTIGADCLASGDDLRFTLADGTLCSAEKDNFAVTEGAANGTFWVLIPNMPTSGWGGLEIYHSGSNGASAQVNATNMWGAAGFDAVYHLPDGSTLSSADSAGNNNGTNNNTAAGAGRLGGGAALDGVGNSKIVTPYAAQLGDFTASAWFKSVGAGYGNYEHIIDKNYLGGFCICRSGSSANTWAAWFLGSGPLCSLTLTDGIWHHIALVRQGTVLTLYGDGVPSAPATVATTLLSTDQLHIGWSAAAYSYNALNGVIDEARISSTYRSAAWIAYDSLTQVNAVTFPVFNLRIEQQWVEYLAGTIVSGSPLPFLSQTLRRGDPLAIGR